MRPTALVAAAVPCRWAGATQHGSRAAYNGFFGLKILKAFSVLVVVSPPLSYKRYLSSKTHALKPKPLLETALLTTRKRILKGPKSVCYWAQARRPGRGAARAAVSTHCSSVGSLRYPCLSITKHLCFPPEIEEPSSPLLDWRLSLSLSLSQGTHAPTLSLHLCSLPRPSRARVCLISSRRASPAPPGAARCLGRTRCVVAFWTVVCK